MGVGGCLGWPRVPSYSVPDTVCDRGIVMDTHPRDVRTIIRRHRRRKNFPATFPAIDFYEFFGLFPNFSTKDGEWSRRMGVSCMGRHGFFKAERVAGTYSSIARITEMSPWASIPPSPSWMGVLRWKAWILLGSPEESKAKMSTMGNTLLAEEFVTEGMALAKGSFDVRMFSLAFRFLLLAFSETVERRLSMGVRLFVSRPRVSTHTLVV